MRIRLPCFGIPQVSIHDSKEMGFIIFFEAFNLLHAFNGLDRNSSNKEKMDFYEYMIVDNSPIKENTFSLINITKNHGSGGSILCEFDVAATNPSTALLLRNYFGKNATVFIELNR